MTPVLTTERIRPPHRPAIPARVTAVVLAAVLGVAVLMLLVRLEGPDFVDEVVVVNETSYRFNVSVAASDDDGVLQLGALGRADQGRFQTVLDQGDAWVFHFDYGGYDGGTLTLTRDELEASGWTVEIPASADQRLRDAGVTPSAEYL